MTRLAFLGRILEICFLYSTVLWWWLKNTPCQRVLSRWSCTLQCPSKWGCLFLSVHGVWTPTTVDELGVLLLHSHMHWDTSVSGSPCGLAMAWYACDMQPPKLVFLQIAKVRPRSTFCVNYQQNRAMLSGFAHWPSSWSMPSARNAWPWGCHCQCFQAAVK